MFKVFEIKVQLCIDVECMDGLHRIQTTGVRSLSRRNSTAYSLVESLKAAVCCEIWLESAKSYISNLVHVKTTRNIVFCGKTFFDESPHKAHKAPIILKLNVNKF